MHFSKCVKLTYIIGAWFASLCFLIIMVVFGALEMNKVTRCCIVR